MTDEHAETHDAAEVMAEAPAATPVETTTEQDHATSVEVAHHDAVTHMDKHTTISDDDHGHAESDLGPIDLGKWAYALAGGAAAIIVLAVFVFALGGLPT